MKHRINKNRKISLTPLLDLIMIMLFLVSVSASGKVQEANEARDTSKQLMDKAELSERHLSKKLSDARNELETLSSEKISLLAELDKNKQKVIKLKKSKNDDKLKAHKKIDAVIEIITDNLDAKDLSAEDIRKLSEFANHKKSAIAKKILRMQRVSQYVDIWKLKLNQDGISVNDGKNHIKNIEIIFPKTAESIKNDLLTQHNLLDPIFTPRKLVFMFFSYSDLRKTDKDAVYKALDESTDVLKSRLGNSESQFILTDEGFHKEKGD